jgi:hypothetical protein
MLFCGCDGGTASGSGSIDSTGSSSVLSMSTLAKLYNHLSASSTNRVLFEKNKLHIHGNEYIDTAHLAPPTRALTPPPVHQHHHQYEYIDTVRLAPPTSISTPPPLHRHHQYTTTSTATFIYMATELPKIRSTQE